MRVNIVQGTIKILKKLDSSLGSTTYFSIIGGMGGGKPNIGVQFIIGGFSQSWRGGGGIS